MELKIFDQASDLAFDVAKMICDQIRKKPDSLICLATGDSPRLAYNLCLALLKFDGYDYSKFTIIGLDEWIGLSENNTGSCSFFLHQYFIDPLQLRKDQFRLFYAEATDLTVECMQMDEFIKSKNGIDLMIVGVGMNGHVGFNEPGSDPEQYSYFTQLDDMTQKVGQKYFEKKTELSKGITLGFKHFFEAKIVLLIASGKHKSSIIQQTVEGPISMAVPSTMIRNHNNGFIMIDQPASSQLKNNTF